MLDPKIISQEQYDEMLQHPEDGSAHMATRYKRIPFVYAHGKLQDDLGSDLFYLFLPMEWELCDGLRAYVRSSGKPVRFFLYKHPRTFELTGVVVYCDGSDSEAYAYGRSLVENKPDRF